jgi:hypothetical protein
MGLEEWKFQEKLKNYGKFHKFITFFDLTVKFDLQTYNTFTFFESASNLPTEKVPYCFLDQPKILTLPWIIFLKMCNLHGPFARGRSQNFKKLQNKSFVVIIIRNFLDPRIYEFLEKFKLLHPTEWKIQAI